MERAEKGTFSHSDQKFGGRETSGEEAVTLPHDTTAKVARLATRYDYTATSFVGFAMLATIKQ